MGIDDGGGFWWHSIELPDGTVTPGEKSLDQLHGEWERMRLPPLAGLNVLDIGAWDGWFSFRAEREGASRVVALDSFTWSLDFSRADEYWTYVARCEAAGETPDLWGPGCDWWDAEGLPGKRGFDTARRTLCSRVEDVVADFTTCDVAELGTFDVVLCLGVLYHLQDLLPAAERLRAVTRQLAVIETAAIGLEAPTDEALFEFLPGHDVNHDPTNWWIPTECGVHGLLRAAGFGSVETVGTDAVTERRPGVTDLRMTIHARP